MQMEELFIVMVSFWIFPTSNIFNCLIYFISIFNRSVLYKGHYRWLCS